MHNENEKNIKDSINRENDNQLIFNKTNYNKSNLKTSNINEQSKKLIVMAFSHNYFDDEEPIYDKKQQNEALNLNLKSYEKDSSDYLHSKKRNRGKPIAIFLDHRRFRGKTPVFSRLRTGPARTRR